jgi:hypothetical protein
MKKKPTLNAEQREAQIINKVCTQIRDLLSTHWPKITELRDDDPKSEVAISFATDVSCSANTPNIKTKISYSQKFRDEIEERLEDPNQAQLFAN